MDREPHVRVDPAGTRSAVNTATVDVLAARWSAIRWFAWIGIGSIVAGGLVAAVTGPLELADGSWAAAYLVLVAGVAQLALGFGQGILSVERPSDAIVRSELAAWNLGAATTIAGTLTGSAVVTTIGAAATATALVMFLVGVRATDETASGWIPMVYRGVAAVVLVSIPVGVALSWIRHG